MSGCVRDALTPTDDGVIIVDCELHGEVGRAVTGGTVARSGGAEAELADAVWCEHTGRPELAAAIRSLVEQGITTLGELTRVQHREQQAAERAMSQMRRRHDDQVEALRRINPHEVNPAHAALCDGTCLRDPDAPRCPRPADEMDPR